MFQIALQVLSVLQGHNLCHNSCYKYYACFTCILRCEVNLLYYVPVQMYKRYYLFYKLLQIVSLYFKLLLRHLQQFTVIEK